MYQGWTQEPTREQKRANELQAVRQILAAQPHNAYWRARLERLTGRTRRAAFFVTYELARMPQTQGG